MSSSKVSGYYGHYVSYQSYQSLKYTDLAILILDHPLSLIKEFASTQTARYGMRIHKSNYILKRIPSIERKCRSATFSETISIPAFILQIKLVIVIQ